jgi:hypothetical protein
VIKKTRSENTPALNPLKYELMQSKY